MGWTEVVSHEAPPLCLSGQGYHIGFLRKALETPLWFAQRRTTPLPLSPHGQRPGAPPASCCRRCPLCISLVQACRWGT